MKMGQMNTDRKSRSDAMAHFPFVDDGTVGEALRNPPDEQGSRIFQMTAPARKRWASQVYQNMCIGRSKMRLADVPEALRVSLLKISD